MQIPFACLSFLLSFSLFSSLFFSLFLYLSLLLSFSLSFSLSTNLSHRCQIKKESTKFHQDHLAESLVSFSACLRRTKKWLYESVSYDRASLSATHIVDRVFYSTHIFCNTLKTINKLSIRSAD